MTILLHAFTAKKIQELQHTPFNNCVPIICSFSAHPPIPTRYLPVLQLVLRKSPLDRSNSVHLHESRTHKAVNNRGGSAGHTTNMAHAVMQGAITSAMQCGAIPVGLERGQSQRAMTIFYPRHVALEMGPFSRGPNTSDSRWTLWPWYPGQRNYHSTRQQPCTLQRFTHKSLLWSSLPLPLPPLHLVTPSLPPYFHAVHKLHGIDNLEGANSIGFLASPQVVDWAWFEVANVWVVNN